MAVLIYGVLRIALVLAAGAVLYLLGLRSWVLVLVAIVVGAGLSYIALDAPRRAAALALERRAGGRRTRIEEAIEAEGAQEDADVEAIVHPSGGFGSGEQSRPEQQAEGELEETRVPQDRDQVPPGSAAEHAPREDHHGGRQH